MGVGGGLNFCLRDIPARVWAKGLFGEMSLSVLSFFFFLFLIVFLV